MCNKLILLSFVALVAVVGITHAQYGMLPYGGGLMGGFGGGGGGIIGIIVMIVIISIFCNLLDNDNGNDGGYRYPQGSGFGRSHGQGGFKPFDINVATNVDVIHPTPAKKIPPGHANKP